MDYYKLVRVLLAVYVAFSIVASFMISVEARTLTSISSAEKDIKLGKRIGIHTIKTDYGSIYDCVDIYKQPALDHPLLKGHKIQMQPSFSVQKRPSNTSTSSTFGLKDECPKGTVPILRMTKERQLRDESSFANDFKASASGLEFAGVSTVPDNTKKYHGAGGVVTTAMVPVQNGQFSASVISIEGGPPEEFGSIRVGWMVNPSLFGDNLTRLYTNWGQGVNGAMHGCYDTDCPGFVLVTSKIPPNVVVYDGSDRPESHVFLKFNITQDAITGNWWFELGNDAGEANQIGYWPSSLFTNLKDGADVLRWGGMVYSDKPESPPMGSGGEDCYFWGLTLADPGAAPGSDSSTAPLEKSESRCYRVGQDDTFKPEFFGYSFWFGGPGGDTNQCH